MLKPKPGKSIEDSLQEVKVLLGKNTTRIINECMIKQSFIWQLSYEIKNYADLVTSSEISNSSYHINWALFNYCCWICTQYFATIVEPHVTDSEYVG